MTGVVFGVPFGIEDVLGHELVGFLWCIDEDVIEGLLFALIHTRVPLRLSYSGVYFTQFCIFVLQNLIQPCQFRLLIGDFLFILTVLSRQFRQGVIQFIDPEGLVYV